MTFYYNKFTVFPIGNEYNINGYVSCSVFVLNGNYENNLGGCRDPRGVTCRDLWCDHSSHFHINTLSKNTHTRSISLCSWRHGMLMANSWCSGDDGHQPKICSIALCNDRHHYCELFHIIVLNYANVIKLPVQAITYSTYFIY